MFLQGIEGVNMMERMRSHVDLKVYFSFILSNINSLPSKANLQHM